jgi:uncharacterized membrane protein (UPF0127 family)
VNPVPRPLHRPPALARRVAAVALTAVVAAGGCGDDDGSAADPPAGTESSESSESSGSSDPMAGEAADGPAEPLSLDDLAAASGAAPAAAGADLAEPPGPAERTGLVGSSEAAASITAADGTVTGCCLLVAADEEQRQWGLMEVTDLGGYQGMVFVWDDDVLSGFWMRNTPTPLSIAWFDAEGLFVSSTDMKPCPADAADCPIYPPEGEYRFALEVFKGKLEALGVGPGSRLALGGKCAGAAGSG